jgi:histidinol-phosphatase (PHP family)
MERTCARAAQLGLRSVAFTDHADRTVWTVLAGGASLPPPLRDHLSGGILTPPGLDLDGYQQCLERCRDMYRELKIWSGVELSEPHWHPGWAAALLRRGRFDLVVCGLHSLRRPDLIREVSDGYAEQAPADVVREYLGEAVRMIGAWDDFEVLAHIDFPVRTWPGRGAGYRTGDFEAEYRAVLRALAGSGRVLEINTRVPLDPHIVGWWRQEGGAAVSFGSDAHDPLGLARGFTGAAAMAEAAGFRPGATRHDFWVRA